MAKESAVIKYGSTTIGIGSGNAFAYFGMKYLAVKYGVTFDDPAVAVAMGGTAIGVVFMELGKVFGKLGAGVKYVFDRVFPPKYDQLHEDDHKDT